MKLTNRDIAIQYKDYEFWFMLSDFRAAFAYWVTYQNPNGTFIADKATEAFEKHVRTFFSNPTIPERFSYHGLASIISVKKLEEIPEIMELNTMKPDFIDLGALALNVFYMMLREHITQYDLKEIKHGDAVREREDG